jgi:pimeloyl-ACP methyl ester carboxylesterase
MTAASLYKTEAGRQQIMAFYDAALNRWPVPQETRYVETPHGSTFVITCGKADAPPLVLLHGAGANSATWLADVEAYSQHFRVYLVDLIGEAGKSAPNRPSWEGAAFAEWLEAVMNQLGLEQAILVGISQGAWTALKFATQHPQRVTKLVLLTPGGVVPDKVSFLLRAILFSLLGRWGSKRLLRMVFGKVTLDKETEAIFLLVFEQFKARIGTLPIFTDEELRRLTMPTLLIMGDEDALRDANKISTRLRGLLPRLETVILPELGHVLINMTPHTIPFLTKPS